MKRVLLLDRAPQSGYTRGLGAGLRNAGLDVLIGTAENYAHGEDTLAVYARCGVPGRRMRKVADAVVGGLRLLDPRILFSVDVMHLQWSGFDNVVFCAIARILRRTVVFTEHNPVQRSDEVPERSARLLYGMAHRIVVHSRALAEGFSTSWPQYAAKVVVLPHGALTHQTTSFSRAEARQRLELPREAIIFSFVGQIRPRKGLATLLSAFQRYRHGGGKGELVVTGTVADSAYGNELRASVEPGLPIHWKVSDRGLPHEDLDATIAASDCVVFPFDSATQSGSVILAMGAGACVIATNVGAVGETVDGRGVVVPPRDPEQMADAMQLIEGDPDRRQALAARARQYCEEDLSWDRIGEQTKTIYEEAHRRGPSHRSLD